MAAGKLGAAQAVEIGVRSAGVPAASIGAAHAQAAGAALRALEARAEAAAPPEAVVVVVVVVGPEAAAVAAGGSKLLSNIFRSSRPRHHSDRRVQDRQYRPISL